METFWQWFGHLVAAVLIGIGTVLLVIGLGRTSYKNGGGVSIWVGKFRARLNRLRNRRLRPISDYTGTAGRAGANLSGEGTVSAGGLGSYSSDPDPIFRLWTEIAKVRSELALAKREVDQEIEAVRHEHKQSTIDLELKIERSRRTVEAGIRHASLDGLGLAALGALLIGAGDSIGAWMIFAGM